MLQLSNIVTVIWIPGRSGIPGNEIVDKMAQEATNRQHTFIPIPFSDFFRDVRGAIYEQ